MAIFGFGYFNPYAFLTFKCGYTLPKEPSDVKSSELLQMVCRFVITPSDTAVRQEPWKGGNKCRQLKHFEIRSFALGVERSQLLPLGLDVLVLQKFAISGAVVNAAICLKPCV